MKNWFKKIWYKFIAFPPVTFTVKAAKVLFGIGITVLGLIVIFAPQWLQEDMYRKAVIVLASIVIVDGIWLFGKALMDKE